MQRYNFRLKRILGVKQVIRDIRQREMAQAVQELERENQILRGFDTEMISVQDFIVAKTRGRFTISELMVHYGYIGLLQVNMDKQKERISEASQNVRQVNEKLVKAHREREVISRLEEHAKEEYKDAVLKEEQGEIDEIGSAAFFKDKNVNLMSHTI